MKEIVVTAPPVSRELRRARNRIVARKDCGIVPLLGAEPKGHVSPSPSLLVERFDLHESHWQTHMHPDQVIALYLQPTTMRHQPLGGSVSEISLVRGQVAICNRSNWESFHWAVPTSFLCTRVADSALNEAARSLLDVDCVQLTATPRAEDPRMTSLLYALEAERERDYSAGRLFLDSIEAALAALLVTCHSAAPLRRTPHRGGLPPQRMRRVLEFMHANLDKQLKLEDLASCAGLSLSHFCHQFRKTSDATPSKYMLTLRIERSKEMLKNPKLSVLEVALAVGFENQQHFATVFRRLAGMSPSSYRWHL